MAQIRIGISGWRYQPWRGVFYPPRLAHHLELWYASRILPAIEINGSFYSLQRPEYYAHWHAQTPHDFVFAVKGPRFITHMKRLREVETPLANFLASGLFNLGRKLGPMLWQFPPQFRYDRERMERFFGVLPHDTQAAQALARQHDARMRGRSQLRVSHHQALRHAVEIRHASFLQPSFIELLREYRIALVIAETAQRWPLIHDVTADFMYLRLHGDEELYRSGYDEAALAKWAQRIQAWHAGGEPPAVEKVTYPRPIRSAARDVYCFFDNTDVKLRAPRDAQTLMRKLGLQPGAPRLPVERPSP
jgi:uncharacterized protein YecE (DUF72 family)